MTNETSKGDIKTLRQYIETRNIKIKTDVLISANELYHETQEIFENALFSLNYINQKLNALESETSNEKILLARERLVVIKAIIQNNLRHLQDSLDEVPKILVEFDLIDN